MKTKSGLKAKYKEVPRVQILDPAVGTGTFLKHTIGQIKKTFDEKHKDFTDEELKKKWNEYVPKHLLPRLFGFELMMAPYAVGHLKIGLELAETGYDFKSKKRLGVYLTNTLEGTHEGAGTLDAYLNWLADEVHRANMIKANYPISVIIGNPPYSGHSANKSDWLRELLRGKAPNDKYKRNYFEVDGEPLGERNPKWLNDDYVKFIRFGQWRIDKTGEGILAFITNHSYLDNPTFRGMRQQLMESFTDIYILDLHGNSKRKKSVLMVQKMKMFLTFNKVLLLGFL
jgi:Predicted helicase